MYGCVTAMVAVLATHTGLCPTDKLVLVTLAKFAAPDGSRVRPSVATIAECAEVSPRRVHYALRALETAGWICPVRRRYRKPTEYRLVVPGLTEPAQLDLLNGCGLPVLDLFAEQPRRLQNDAATMQAVADDQYSRSFSTNKTKSGAVAPRTRTDVNDFKIRRFERARLPIDHRKREAQ